MVERNKNCISGQAIAQWIYWQSFQPWSPVTRGSNPKLIVYSFYKIDLIYSTVCLLKWSLTCENEQKIENKPNLANQKIVDLCHVEIGIYQIMKTLIIWQICTIREAVVSEKSMFDQKISFYFWLCTHGATIFVIRYWLYIFQTEANLINASRS